MIIDISELNLNEVTSDENSKSQIFDYGSVRGVADVIGWQIVFFRDSDSPDVISAISLDDIVDNNILEEIGTKIINKLGLKVTLGDSYESILKEYGEPRYKDELLESMISYVYSFNEDTLVIFGIKEGKGFTSLEVIQNKEIHKERIEIYTYPPS